MTTGPLKEGVELRVVVDGFDDEGRGRAVQGAFDIAVRGALPGDVAVARVERVFPAHGIAQARALHLETRGPLHVARDCPHLAPCAGCPLHGVEPTFALDVKRARCAQALVDHGLANAQPVLHDVRPARGPRQKIKLTAGGHAGALRFGLFVPHTHVLVGAESCPHHHPALVAATARVRGILNAHRVAAATKDALSPSAVKALIARVFCEGVGVVLVTTGELPSACTADLGACVGAETGIASLALRVDAQRGNSIVGGATVWCVGPPELTPLDGQPAVSADAFCQTDAALAHALYEEAAAFVLDGLTSAERAGAHIVDAYAGTGGFSRALKAAGAGHVTAIERDGASAAALRQQAVTAVLAPVEDALPRVQRPVTGLVLDPPKQGLRDVAVAAAALGAARVVLVACDPDSGARDARALVDGGYRLVRVEPFDLFPASTEIETAFFFVRTQPSDRIS